MYTVIRHQLKREAKIRTDEKIELGDVAVISTEFRKGELEIPSKGRCKSHQSFYYFLQVRR